MKLDNLIVSYSTKLFEAKARIEHPEDLIFDHGLAGAITAMHALQTTASKPEYVSLKLDGSPALVFGWLGEDFVLTDKWGFRSKKYNGLTTSPEAIVNMITSRKTEKTSPQGIRERRQYAEDIAKLYPILRAATPKTLDGYAQGDLMWTDVPPIVDGNYVFKKNKITYKIPVSSEIGQKIADSKVGISIHSLWHSPHDNDPESINPKNLGFVETDGLVILPHEVHFKKTFTLNQRKLSNLHKIIKSHGPSVRKFFNAAYLGQFRLKSLPMMMKSFVAHKASQGSNDFSHVGDEFLQWISSPLSSIAAKTQNNILTYVQNHISGYNAVWQIVKLIIDLKTDLKKQMDAELHGVVSGELAGEEAQEGYVSVTPDAVIKLIDRPKFMKKGPVTKPDSTQEPDSSESKDTSTPVAQTTDDEQLVEDTKHKGVVWTFMRANPPHIGHLKVFHKMKKIAEHRGDDWFIFLSHSHDIKKNPLAWETKIEFIKKMMPEYADHICTYEDIRTPLQAADLLYNEGYRDMVIVVGADRVHGMQDLMKSWNSDSVRTEYLRQPVNIKIVNAGEREEGDVGIKGASSTKAREAASQGNLNAFKHAIGYTGNTTTQLFHAVRQGQQPKLAEAAQHHKDGTIVMFKMHPESAQKLNEWCSSNKLPCISPEDLHMTVLYSKHPVPHLESMHGNKVRVECKPTHWKKMGESALVLVVDGDIPHQFHKSLLKQGGTHEYAEYIPHTSVDYDWKWGDLPINVPDFPLVYDTIHVDCIDPNYGEK